MPARFRLNQRSNEGDPVEDPAIAELLVEVEDRLIGGVIVGPDPVHPELDCLDECLQLQRTGDPAVAVRAADGRPVGADDPPFDRERKG